MKLSYTQHGGFESSFIEDSSKKSYQRVSFQIRPIGQLNSIVQKSFADRPLLSW